MYVLFVESQTGLIVPADSVGPPTSFDLVCFCDLWCFAASLEPSFFSVCRDCQLFFLLVFFLVGLQFNVPLPVAGFGFHSGHNLSHFVFN